jgi:hypothetical protein
VYFSPSWQPKKECTWFDVELEANIRGGGNPFTSSLNISPEACCRKMGWGSDDSRLAIPLLPSMIRGYILFKDDVTVLLLLGVSFDARSMHLISNNSYTWMCLGVEPGELLSSVLELGAAAGVARSRLARRKLLQLLFMPAAASAADKA